MTAALKSASGGKYDKEFPPRERILAVAAELFYRHGIRAIGVELIAESAGTNKMTLYRHFTSKDELVAEYLRRLAEKASASWDRLAVQHPANPRAQLRGWLEEWPPTLQVVTSAGARWRMPRSSCRTRITRRGA